MAHIIRYMRIFRAITSALFLYAGLSSFAGAESSKLAPGPHDAPLADVSLHYTVAGQGPVVLAVSPGWGVGSLYMQKGFAPLEKDYTMVYIDTRGSGGSTHPADNSQMSAAVMADDLDRLRSYLGLDSIALMGHSNGGAIALDYAERYPTHIKKLILLDAQVYDDREREATKKFLTAWADDPRYKSAVASAAVDSPVTNAEEFDKMLESILPLYFSDPVRYLPAFTKTLEGTHLSVYAYNAQDKADQLHPRKQSLEYGNVQARTLIISGTVDWVCPYEVSQRMHAGIKGSQLSLYANTGHLTWIEQPERFFAEVSQFLGN